MGSKIICQIVPRIFIGLLGGGLGFSTIIPNMMISDSGTPMAMCGAYIGLCASASFVGGGLLGAIFKRRAFLLPGMILQIGAFTAPPIISKLGLIESEDSWKREREVRRTRRREKEEINRQSREIYKFNPNEFLGGTGNPEKTFFANDYKKYSDTTEDDGGEK